jgi:hypothetical protein
VFFFPALARGKSDENCPFFTVFSKNKCTKFSKTCNFSQFGLSQSAENLKINKKQKTNPSPPPPPCDIIFRL